MNCLSCVFLILVPVRVYTQFSKTINIISRYIKLQWCSEIVNLLFTAGEFGIVYRARLIRSTPRRTDCEIVAVKTVKGKDMIQPRCQLHMLPLMLFLLCTIKAKWEFYEVLSHDSQGLYYFALKILSWPCLNAAENAIAKMSCRVAWNWYCSILSKLAGTGPNLDNFLSLHLWRLSDRLVLPFGKHGTSSRSIFASTQFSFTVC